MLLLRSERERSKWNHLPGHPATQLRPQIQATKFSTKHLDVSSCDFNSKVSDIRASWHPSGSSIMYDDHLWLSSQPTHSEATSWDFGISQYDPPTRWEISTFTTMQARAPDQQMHANAAINVRMAATTTTTTTTISTTFYNSHLTWSEVATAFQGLMLRWQAADGLTCWPWCLPSHPARWIEVNEREVK